MSPLRILVAALVAVPPCEWNEDGSCYHCGVVPEHEEHDHHCPWKLARDSIDLRRGVSVPPSQEELTEQLGEAAVLCRMAGLYDAADHLLRVLDRGELL